MNKMVKRIPFFIAYLFLAAAVTLGVNNLVTFLLPNPPELYAELTALSDAATPGEYTPVLNPKEIVIPAISVRAPVEHLGLDANGDMKAPSTLKTVSWYTGSARPGTSGNAVFAGHLDNALGTAAVFQKLEELKLGDTIVVTGEHSQITFAVTRVGVYGEEDSTGDLFNATDPGLVLITCEGVWDGESYDKRRVVYAELVT